MTGGTAMLEIVSRHPSAELEWQERHQPDQSGGSLHCLEVFGVTNGEPFKLPTSGLCCQHCGEALPRVHHTRTTRGFILRERICPRCDRINTTSERILSVRKRKRTFSDPCE